jgi:hypothetical protein
MGASPVNYLNIVLYQRRIAMKRLNYLVLFGASGAFILAMIAALVGWVVPAAASSPVKVKITSAMVFLGNTGTFEASGPAVEAGLICPAGNVYDTKYRSPGSDSKRFINLFVHKLFVCADGSGSFEMDLNLRIFSPPRTKGTWRIVDGDGAYARLHGNGKLSAYRADEDTVIDLYNGKLHID